MSRTDAAAPASTAQGVALLSTAHAALVVFGYAIHIVLSRVLGPADYGRFVVVLSTSSWVKVSLGALIVPGLCKIVSEDPARLRAALTAGGRWHWGITAVLTAGLLAGAPLIARLLGDAALTPLLIVAAVEVPFFAGMMLGRSLLAAMQRYVWGAITFIHYAFFRAAGACALVLLGLGAMGGTLGLAAGSVVGGVMGMTCLYRLRARLPDTPYPPMVRRALSWTALTLPAGMGLVTLMSLDMWLVKALIADPAAAGIYGAAFTVSRIPDVMVQGLISAVFARVSYALAQDDRAQARAVASEAMRFLLIVFAPICALTCGASGEIVRLLFSKRYDAGAGLLGLLIVAMSFAGGLKLMLSLLSAADHPGRRLAFVAALLPVSLALNVVLIRRYGLPGAAYASLFTMILGAGVGAVLVHQLTAAWPPLLTAVRAALAGGVVYALARFVPAQGAGLIVKLLVLFVAYGALLLLFREITWRELRSLPQRMTGRSTRTVRESAPPA